MKYFTWRFSRLRGQKIVEVLWGGGVSGSQKMNKRWKPDLREKWKNVRILESRGDGKTEEWEIFWVNRSILFPLKSSSFCDSQYVEQIIDRYSMWKTLMQRWVRKNLLLTILLFFRRVRFPKFFRSQFRFSHGPVFTFEHCTLKIFDWVSLKWLIFISDQNSDFFAPSTLQWNDGEQGTL